MVASYFCGTHGSIFSRSSFALLQRMACDVGQFVFVQGTIVSFSVEHANIFYEFRLCSFLVLWKLQKLFAPSKVVKLLVIWWYQYLTLLIEHCWWQNSHLAIMSIQLETVFLIMILLQFFLWFTASLVTNAFQIRPLFEGQGKVLEVALIKDKRTGQQQGMCLWDIFWIIAVFPFIFSGLLYGWWEQV